MLRKPLLHYLLLFVHAGQEIRLEKKGKKVPPTKLFCDTVVSRFKHWEIQFVILKWDPRRSWLQAETMQETNHSAVRSPLAKRYINGFECVDKSKFHEFVLACAFLISLFGVQLYPRQQEAEWCSVRCSCDHEDGLSVENALLTFGLIIKAPSPGFRCSCFFGRKESLLMSAPCLIPAGNHGPTLRNHSSELKKSSEVDG